MGAILAFLIALVGSLPGLLVVVAGIIVACMLWSTAVRPARLLLIAALLELLALTVGAWFHGIYLPSLVRAGDIKSMQIATLIGLFGLLLNVLHAVAWGVLIWAVATGRRLPRPPPIR